MFYRMNHPFYFFQKIHRWLYFFLILSTESLRSVEVVSPIPEQIPLAIDRN